VLLTAFMAVMLLTIVAGLFHRWIRRKEDST
jgi:hypothetical protein